MSTPPPRRTAASSCVLVLLLAALLVAGPPAAPVAAEASPSPVWRHELQPRTDWVLATSTTPTTREFGRRLRVYGTTDGRRPLIVGVAESIRGGRWPGTSTSVWTVPHGHGRVELRLGDERVGVVLSPPDRRGDFVLDVEWETRRMRSISALLFVENGTLRIADWKRVGAPVRTRDTVRSGRGTTALTIDTIDDATALTAGGVTAATATHTRTPARGIVGAIDTTSCQACGGEWDAPRGPARTWAHTRHVDLSCWSCFVPGASIDTAFAGPAGRWRWSWSGVAAPPQQRLRVGVPHLDVEPLVTRPTFALYAPIGPSWRLFRQEPGLG